MNMNTNNIPNPSDDSDWTTHAEHEAKRGTRTHDNFGNAIPSGWELDPVWGPINGALRPTS